MSQTDAIDVRMFEPMAAFTGMLLNFNISNLFKLWRFFYLRCCLICSTYNHIKMLQIFTILRPFKATEFLYTHRHLLLGGARIIYKAEDVFLLIRRFYWFINRLFIAFTDDLSDLSSLSSPKTIKGKATGHLILLD